MSDDLIKRKDAIKAFTFNSKGERIPFVDCDNFPVEFPLRYIVDTLVALLPADRPQGEWIDCKEPPSTDRNVFIAYGTDNMKSVCIGHYEHDMKLWYEDRNFFAKPLFDGMYWCEIPQFPTRMKGADDEC